MEMNVGNIQRERERDRREELAEPAMAGRKAMTEALEWE